MTEAGARYAKPLPLMQGSHRVLHLVQAARAPLPALCRVSRLAARAARDVRRM